MGYEYDTQKSARNRQDASRGFGFGHAGGFDWKTSVTVADDRKDYSEPRYISYGLIDGRLHVLVWTPRGNKKRIISLRKANKKERGLYYEE